MSKLLHEPLPDAIARHRQQSFSGGNVFILAVTPRWLGFPLPPRWRCDGDRTAIARRDD